MDCPQCSNLARMLKTDKRQGGKKWRRWCCTSCSYRWSTVDGAEVSYRNDGNKRKRRFTDEQAREIIMSPLSLRRLAEIYGIRALGIWKIKHGITYRDVWLELQAGTERCEDCCYWAGGCAFDFPEAGSSFAQECSMFENRARA